tara:strand:+ start:1312 stop:1680 length:369 start_codon:yes stop_codon:yes gene_type:complete
MDDPLFTGRGFLVTAKILRTKRRTYDLKNVEYVSIHQPLLVILGVTAIGLFLFTFSFFRYLYAWEIFTMLAVSAASVGVAAFFGSMTVHSIALREEQTPLFGDIRTLRKVKDAVEEVISSRD